MPLKSLFIKLFEILSIILSALTLRYIQVRGRYWQEKIEIQLRGINTNERIRKHIIDIVEDIYVSLSMLGQAILILYGLFVIVGKEINEKPSSIFSIGPAILILLSLGFFVAIIKLFKLKETLIDRPTLCWTRYTYKQVYEMLLYIGYGALLFMSVREVIIILLK
jgi:hypothetical protein